MIRDPLRGAPLNALRAFESLVRSGSHAAAAADLGVTVSALSHQLRKLEVHVGVALFVSGGRRFTLTPTGRELATAIVEGFGCMRAGLATLGKAQALRVAVCSLFACGSAVRQWSALESRTGERLELCFSALPQVSSKTDVAVCARSPSLGHLDSISVFAGSAAPIATPFVRDRIGQKDFDRVWLSCTRWGDAVTQWCANSVQGLDEGRIVRAEGFAGLYAACVRGIGLAMLPIELIREDLRKEVLVDVFPEMPRLQVEFALHFAPDRLDLERMRRLAQALSRAAIASFVAP